MSKLKLPSPCPMTEPLEAIEHLAGGHLDDVDNTKIKKPWNRAKGYVNKHGGKTTAGASTTKGYKLLSKACPRSAAT